MLFKYLSRKLFLKKVVLDYTDHLERSTLIAKPEGESVLDTLLNNGHDIPYSCKAGVCQNCIMQAETQSESLRHAQKGLNSAQISLGHFLSCSCFPKTSLKIKSIQTPESEITANVISNEWLNDHIIRLRIDAPFDFQAGQFCNLSTPSGITRSYSIASIPEDGYLEFHIKVIKNGQFSAWAANDLKIGDSIAIQGPIGECFYACNDKTSPILLSGVGTGLAPLYGIIHAALKSGHTGDIHLILAAKTEDNFYLVNELTALSDTFNHFSVTLLSHSPVHSTNAFLLEGDIYDHVDTYFTSLKDFDIYLCGAPTFIHKMKKRCFLSGASMSAILSDIFSPAKT